MTVIESTKDPEALTLTIVSEYDAPQERVWQLWSDPRQLELWWGPPGYPATFEVFEFEPGGRATYYMSLPEGGKAWGWWRFVEIEPTGRIAIDDGFAEEGGAPAPGEPGRMMATLEERDGRTRMTILNQFASTAQMNELLEMGQEQGMTLALDQIDAILAGTLTR
ncbi:polyketide cyclase [Leifsonia xyli]|uniref:SRPBCC family protein n=1 Tax=Leifsonia xyli TaxID=1575 RepID=UPI0007CDAFBA|nr:polyketide cyclase [Leifsonia xyli]